MTCIVAIAEEGRVVMGGDSAGVNGWDLQIRRDPKVFKRGAYLMGFTSSFRMGQLLRFDGELPEPPADDDDLERFMAKVFIASVRRILFEGGFSRKENNEETGGRFLVGLRGSLVCMGPDFTVETCAEPYMAVGCGASVALGALCALRERVPDPRERATIALEAAHTWSAGVRPPFLILETDPIGGQPQ